MSIHAHLQAYLCDIAALPGGEREEAPGLTACRTPFPWPMFNGALATPEAGDIGAPLARLAVHGLPWFMWATEDTPPAALEAAARAGAVAFDGPLPWMEARIAELPEPEPAPGVTIEEVADEGGHRLWARLVREIYGFPALGERAWVMPAEACGWSGLPYRQWIAYADGEAAAVTMLYCGGGIAGLYGVGTLPAARRRGLGRLVTVLPLKASGHEIAGFFSTPEGEPLYRSLGFAATGSVSRWLGNAAYLAGSDAA